MTKTRKSLIFVTADLLSVLVAWVLTFWICEMPVGSALKNNWYWLLLSAGTTFAFSFLLGLYSNIWRYAGALEALKIIAVSLCVTACNLVIKFVSKQPLGFSWWIIVSLLTGSAIMGSRFAFRFYAIVDERLALKDKRAGHVPDRVCIIGGGDAGALIIREMQNSDRIDMRPVCILDDDNNKAGQWVNGVKVVGKISDVEEVVKKLRINKIIIAIPSASRQEKSEIIQKCQKTACKVLTLPGLYQFASGEISVSSIKEVSIADLLGREQVQVNTEEIMDYIEGKTVLVTGGGGSIGSELCRQIALHSPKKLIIFDVYENNAYEIEQELIRKHPELNLSVLIGSVRDVGRVNKVFSEYKPDIVFHAAAHKHVPLMETSPNEAVKNNVVGTYNVADAAGRNGVEKFVLISTDKAVNPTNIMGATKRICEMIIQTINKKYDTDYVAVRFGNVLGSNGSVIPLFKKQIAEGGPVLVTDRNINRYFMTIPEAVSLVLQAGAYAKGGEIFVLDMGEPVKIYDLAENMIRLSGFEPHKDIEIKITGLRPGEKLYEERLMREEGLEKTANDMISIGKPIDMDENKLFPFIEKLRKEAYLETDSMKEMVSELVPTYKIDKRFG